MNELLHVPDGAFFDLALNGAVLELSFNQPERRNPLGYRTVTGLVDTLRRADLSDEVRCVLIYGQGGAFTAGADLAEFSSQLDGSAYEFHATGDAWASLLTLIPRLSKPVVVAAHGYAMAGGVGILAVADVALAAEKTTFASSEVRIGLFPLMILPALSQAVGPRRARELALTGRRFSADEALRIGLVHETVDDEVLLEAARSRATDLAALGKVTLALGKAFLHDIDGLPRESATQLGRAVRGAFMTSPDFQAGVSAFLSKSTAPAVDHVEK
ncbi:enoyl-CoA hydratase/isomerase family protein [Intrasporangium calvum]|uniref:Enoyl-CoA hydratase/isomerase family protein n=1 Tax=Intrasporangium calvum TaxID=53358 RepID=A0ABT5GE58_9MICO|nr:enoyl-CoA hydratase/isomerase family protein [Intrasporangium calvum]MDC5696539.1 enoyl-CoA hydratase/isomerase family protein [Intrasporangium calvum]